MLETYFRWKLKFVMFVLIRVEGVKSLFQLQICLSQLYLHLGSII